MGMDPHRLNPQGLLEELQRLTQRILTLEEERCRLLDRVKVLEARLAKRPMTP